MSLPKVIAASFALSALSITPVLADTYELRQEIYGPECTHTSLETAAVQNDLDCPIFRPAVAGHRIAAPQLIIEGVYDATHAASLEVWFEDRRYALGATSPLRVSADRWMLNVPAPTEPGSYTVAANMRGVDNHDYISSTYQVVIEQPVTPLHLAQFVSTRLANTGYSFVLAVLAAVGSLLLGSWLWRKRSRPLEDSS